MGNRAPFLLLSVATALACRGEAAARDSQSQRLSETASQTNKASSEADTFLFALGRIQIRFGRDLTIEVLESLLEVTLKKTGGQNLTGRSRRWPIVVDAATSQGNAITDVQLALRLELQIRLKDLEKTFGPAQVIARGKASAIAFPKATSVAQVTAIALGTTSNSEITKVGFTK